MQWYLKVLKQYADFSGRARRTEFWMFTLFNSIASIVLGLIDTLIGTSTMLATGSGSSTRPACSRAIYALAVLIPSLAVSRPSPARHRPHRLVAADRADPARRRHRPDRLLCLEGNRGPNQHGMDPKSRTPWPAATRSSSRRRRLPAAGRLARSSRGTRASPDRPRPDGPPRPDTGSGTRRVRCRRLRGHRRGVGANLHPREGRERAAPGHDARERSSPHAVVPEGVSSSTPTSTGGPGVPSSGCSRCSTP